MVKYKDGSIVRVAEGPTGVFLFVLLSDDIDNLPTAADGVRTGSMAIVQDDSKVLMYHEDSQDGWAVYTAGGGGGGVTPTGDINITANGTYDVTDKAGAVVNVPNTFTAADEDKVVYNGALVAQSLQLITSNGMYDTTRVNRANINVANHYSASDEGKVVESGALVSQSSQNINSNGTYNTTKKSQVIVNVPNSYQWSDEGKVVQNGALVSQYSDIVREDGTYDTTIINSLTVETGGGGGALLDELISGETEGDFEIESDVTKLRDCAFAGFATPGNFNGDFQYVTGTGDRTFEKLSASIVALNLPLVESFGDSAFSYCHAETPGQLVLPSLLALYNNEFYGCDAFETIDIGESCDYIGPGVFANTSDVAIRVILRNPNQVVTLDDPSAFTDFSGEIYVPDALVSSYQMASNWQDISYKIHSINDLQI